MTPEIPVGLLTPRTFIVESKTFQHYVWDVCVSAADRGVENVLLINGHYLVQDREIDAIVRELTTQHDLGTFHVSLVSVLEEVARLVDALAGLDIPGGINGGK